MSIKARDLDHQERGTVLATRDIVAVAEPERDELSEILDRIDAARTIQPHAKDLHCVDCFNRGRDAAIRTIEGKPR